MIEKLRKKPVEVETMLWDGTDKRRDAIVAWVDKGPGAGDRGFTTPELAAHDAGVVYLPEPGDEDAWLWVAHNKRWTPLPIGYRVAREIDGTGFYPLSPEGARAGYETPDGGW